MQTNSFELFENVNAINAVNAVNAVSDVNAMANCKSLDLKLTRSDPSARPLGQASPETFESTQEGEGVVESRPDQTLTQERDQLIQRGDWIRQHEVTYAVVSLWLTEPNNFDSIKAQYAIKRERAPMSHYSVALTKNPYDYIGNVKRRWPDAEDHFYQEWYEVLKQSSVIEANCFAGKSLATRSGFNTGKIIRMPISAFTGMMVTQDDTKWEIHLKHHDFQAFFAIPHTQFAQQLDKWIRTHAVDMEAKRSKRTRNVPPFARLEWRA